MFLRGREKFLKILFTIKGKWLRIFYSRWQDKGTLVWVSGSALTPTLWRSLFWPLGWLLLDEVGCSPTSCKNSMGRNVKLPWSLRKSRTQCTPWLLVLSPTTPIFPWHMPSLLIWWYICWYRGHKYLIKNIITLKLTGAQASQLQQTSELQNPLIAGLEVCVGREPDHNSQSWHTQLETA